jgi:hypothetical protein
VLLELLDEQPEEIANEEKEKHTAIWLTYEELIEQITHEYNKV